MMVPHLVDAPAAGLPAPEIARRWGQVALRVEGPQGLAERLEAWRARVAVRRLRVPASGDPAATLAAAGPGVRVDWVVDAEAAERLPGVAPSRWRAQGVVPWAVPAPVVSDGLLGIVARAGTAGWPVALPPTPALLVGEAPLLELLDFYLFHPGLAVPVEPFHSLLVGLIARRPRGLWEIWFGLPEDRFYVDADGHVSLCELWVARPDRRYGTAGDPPTTWRASAAHAALGALLRGETRADPACPDCEALPACGGALRALHPQASCALWREVVARLRLAAATLQRRVPGGRRRGRPAGSATGPEDRPDPDPRSVPERR